MQINVNRAVETIQDMINSLIALLPNIVLAVIVFGIFFFISRGVRMLVRRLTVRYQNYRAVGVLLGRLAQGAITLVGLLIALTIAVPSFKPSQIIQLLGIGGVAIGFAFKDIFQNFLAGILLLVTEPFRLGDQIVVGDFEGTVEDIQTRATTIRTYDGRRVVIPNANLFTQSVTVNTAFDSRRSEYDFGIGYSDDIDEAKSLVLETVQGTPGVLHEPAPDVLVVSLGDSSVVLRARWWSKPQRGDVLLVQDGVIRRVKSVLTDAGMDLPFPTQVVLFHDQTEETDGDRRKQREGWPAGKQADAAAVPKSRFLAARDAEKAAPLREKETVRR